MKGRIGQKRRGGLKLVLLSCRAQTSISYSARSELYLQLVGSCGNVACTKSEVIMEVLLIRYLQHFIYLFYFMWKIIYRKIHSMLLSTYWAAASFFQSKMFEDQLFKPSLR